MQGSDAALLLVAYVGRLLKSDDQSSSIGDELRRLVGEYEDEVRRLCSFIILLIHAFAGTGQRTHGPTSSIFSAPLEGASYA